MEIHKPKPVHNWRDFIKEVGIIVLGVCIALIAEQAVQTVHEHAKAAEARASIRAEIASERLQSGHEPSKLLAQTGHIGELLQYLYAVCSQNTDLSAKPPNPAPDPA